MKQSYWFKRTPSTKKQQTYSQNKIQQSHPRMNKKQINLLTDDTLKNRIKSFAIKLMEIADELKNQKQICQQISNDVVSQNSIKEIRCSIHNSSIILYCVNDHRLLCSACVFNGEFHKRHQIMEVAKAQNYIEEDLKGNQKILRVKAIQMAKQRNVWQEKMQRLQQSFNKCGATLQKQYESVTAAVSKAYQQAKQKIAQQFKNTHQTMSLLISSYSSLVKKLKFQHPLLRIRSVYIQEVLDRQQGFQSFINIQLGDQMITVFEKYSKMMIKNLRNHFG